MTETLTGALEHVKEAPRMAGALELLARTKPELAKLLPPGVTVDRFERTVRTCVRLNPLLLECTAESFLGAVMHSAQLGLEPGPLGLVYLVPFKRDVTLIVGYRGFVELAYRSGLVKDITAELVRDGDTFREVRGTSPKITHEVGPPAERGEVTAAYSVAHLKSGGTVSRVVYPDEWERARKASILGAKNAGPWHDDRDAMIRKTALRRLEPWLPKTPQLADAIAWDESTERIDDLIAGDPLPVPAPTESEGENENTQ